MLKCEVCNKNRIYVCSDGMNAWCQKGCGNYFHEDGGLIFLGKIGCDYPIRDDGTVIKVTRIENGNKTTIEEERLVEIEEKINKIMGKKRKERKLKDDCDGWFYKLNQEERLKIYLQSTTK